MTKEQITQLLAPFTPNEVQWRLRNFNENGGYAVPYMDSRAIQNRLDTVLGKDNWQNSFSVVSSGNAKEPTVNVCTISIYYPDRKEWISKSDGAGASDIEPAKGGLSDAFKRAASIWGIGRYMYLLDEQWVDIEKKGNSKIVAKSALPKLNTYYEKAVAEIFGTKPPSKNSKKTDASAQPPVKSPAEPQSGQEPKTQLYTVESANTTKGKNNAVNTALRLLKPDGSKVIGYVRGDPGLKKGQKLSNIKATTKDDPNIGKYYIIDEYQVAA